MSRPEQFETDYVAVKKETNFCDMRLWIIQDNDYSELRKAEGCGDFQNLPATPQDAVEIKRMAMMLGIKRENIKHFSGASKRDLSGYYKLLKKEYSKLMRQG